MQEPKHFEYDHWHYDNTPATVIVTELLKIISPRSVLDVGCGSGNWLSVFAAQGIEDYLGLDLSDHEKDFLIDEAHFQKTDLNQPFDIGRKFDLVTSLEVAEHLKPETGPGFVRSLLNHGDTILFSAAVPHQKGTNHINTRWQEYWIGLFAEHGLQANLSLRNLLWDDDRVSWWYRQNMILFSRTPLHASAPKEPVNVIHPAHYEFVHRRLEQAQAELNTFNSPKACGRQLLKCVKSRFAQKLGRGSGQ